MKQVLVIALVLFGGVTSSFAQSFADKNHYLVDSLDLSKLSASDAHMVDSCLKVYHSAKQDTLKLKTINHIVEVSYDDYLWIKYNEWVLVNSKDKPGKVFKKAYSGAVNNKGYYYNHHGQPEKAIKFYERAVELERAQNNKEGLATGLNNLAYIYQNHGQIEKAIDYYEQALKYDEELDNKEGLAVDFNNLGVIYHGQEQFVKAAEYYEKSIELMIELNKVAGVPICYRNLGLICSDNNKYEEAAAYFEKSLELELAQGNDEGIAASYNNLADVYVRDAEKLGKAKEFYQKSLEIYTRLNNTTGIATALNNLSTVYSSEGNYEKAIASTRKSFEVAREIGNPELVRNVSRSLYLQTKSTKNFEEALEMHELYIAMRDSINNITTQKASIKQQTKYEFEKKQAISEAEHEKEFAILAEKKKQQQLLLYAAAGGLILVFVFLAFVFNRLKITRAQNKEIEKQKEEADYQRAEAIRQTEIAEGNMNTAIQLRMEVEQHHLEIQDSIEYAKRIQDAIMPSMESIKRDLGDCFVLYLPKDIVAGDFFWLESVAEALDSEGERGEVIYFAAADCTGHGVPGAMVSVMCSSALTKALVEEGIRDTGKLLDRARELIVERLAKSGEDVNDGMDISLVALRFSKESESGARTATVQWSGANNPLWIIRKDSAELSELKPNKQPVGRYYVEEPFVAHDLQLNAGDQIYLFSDGYQDQFGGPKGKKFKAKQFRQLLLAIRGLSMEDQGGAMLTSFRDWKGDLEQIDDVCVIGVRV